ncbi:Protein of unknown function [Lachnospiraceae bacterium RM5]|nr:Protein of unknown function [Lachnospiraceae bacterium RM5]
MSENFIVFFDKETNKEEKFEIIEEARVSGVNYLLVAYAEDNNEEEADALILKDVSKEDEEEASYEIVEDEIELESIAKVFEEMLEEEDLKFV